MLVEELLADSGIRATLTAVRSAGRGGRLRSQGTVPGCILLDLHLPDAQGLEAVTQMLAAAPAAPVVVLTGLAEESAGLAAVAAGAQDYLIKGQAPPHVFGRAIRYAAQRKQVEQASAALQLSAAAGRGERPAGARPAAHPAAPHRRLRGRRPLPPRPRAVALLGGDFYDVVETPDGTVHAVIGDVCGHGAAEAAIGVCLRVAWRSLVLAGAAAAGADRPARADAGGRAGGRSTCSPPSAHLVFAPGPAQRADAAGRPPGPAAAHPAGTWTWSRDRPGLRWAWCPARPGRSRNCRCPPDCGPGAVHRRAVRRPGRAGQPSGSARKACWPWPAAWPCCRRRISWIRCWTRPRPPPPPMAGSPTTSPSCTSAGRQRSERIRRRQSAGWPEPHRPGLVPAGLRRAGAAGRGGRPRGGQPDRADRATSPTSWRTRSSRPRRRRTGCRAPWSTRRPACAATASPATRGSSSPTRAGEPPSRRPLRSCVPIGRKQPLAGDLGRVERAAGGWRASYALPLISRARSGPLSGRDLTLLDQSKNSFDHLRALFAVQNTHLAAASHADQASLARARNVQDAVYVVILLAFVLAAAALAVLLDRAVIRPLHRLRAASELVAEGRLHPPHPRRPARPTCGRYPRPSRGCAASWSRRWKPAATRRPSRPARRPTWTPRPRSCAGPTASWSSSPTSHRTTCRNRCARSRHSASCWKSATATSSTSAA